MNGLADRSSGRRATEGMGQHPRNAAQARIHTTTDRMHTLRPRAGAHAVPPVSPLAAIADECARRGITELSVEHRGLVTQLEAIQSVLGFPSRTIIHLTVDTFVNLALRHLAEECVLAHERCMSDSEARWQQYEWDAVALERIREEFGGAERSRLALLIDLLWDWTIEHTIHAHGSLDRPETVRLFR